MLPSCSASQQPLYGASDVCRESKSKQRIYRKPSSSTISQMKARRGKPPGGCRWFRRVAEDECSEITFVMVELYQTGSARDDIWVKSACRSDNGLSLRDVHAVLVA